MQMQQLRCFLAVVEHGGFTRAAQQLGRTQQAVSKALRLLEEDVGVRLLDREAGAPRPTAFGLLLLDFARRVTRDEAQFRARLQQVRSASHGTVRIGASVTVAGALVAPATELMRGENPGVAVSVVDGIQPSLEPALARGELDLAVFIRTIDSASHDPDLTFETVSQQDYRLLAGPAHPLAVSGADLAPQSLAAAAWILGANSGDIEAAWRDFFDAAGLAAPTPDLVTTSVEFCRSTLRQNRHLSVLPTGLIDSDLAAGRLVVLPAPGLAWRRPVTLVYRAASLAVPAVLAMIRALHEVAERVSASPGVAATPP